MPRLHILHLEDNALDAELAEDALRAGGHDVRVTLVKSADDLQRALDQARFDLVLADYALPTYDGAAALREVRERDRDVPFIFLSGTLGEDVAIETLRQGATDYVLKHRLDRLAAAVDRALDEANERRERRVAEAQLRRQQEDFHALAETVPEVVYATRADGTVLYVNQRWSALTGQAASEMDLTTAVHPDDLAPMMSAFAKASLVAQSFEFEYRLRTSSGQYRWQLARSRPIPDAQGQVERWVGTATDIHDQKAISLENARLFAEAERARHLAEEASRAKDEFLAVVSHELRTPLNAILGWSKLLVGGALDEPQTTKAIATIERNARAQAQLVDDILDVSRIITGKLRLEVAPVCIRSVLEAAVDVVRPAADSKGVLLEIDLRASAGVLMGDADRLQQVLWNLLANAVKFSAKGSVITVRLAEDAGDCVVTVVDRGQGIPPAFLPHLFERFRQASAGTTRAHAGLGLGLAIVKHLVEMHGGTVSACSDGPGRGSTFVLRLPLALPQEEAATEDTSTRPSLVLSTLPPGPALGGILIAGLRVVVVDDQPDARDLLSSLFEGGGAEVWTAADAASAYQLLRSKRPDVLVSDIGMPGEDGYSLIARVRALDEASGGATPALALTAFARSEDRARALAAGFDAHVAKPFDPGELLAVVARLRDGRAPARPR